MSDPDTGEPIEPDSTPEPELPEPDVPEPEEAPHPDDDPKPAWLAPSGGQPL